MYGKEILDRHGDQSDLVGNNGRTLLP
jgi:hypothetical protein